MKQLYFVESITSNPDTSEVAIVLEKVGKENSQLNVNDRMMNLNFTSFFNSRFWRIPNVGWRNHIMFISRTALLLQEKITLWQ